MAAKKQSMEERAYEILGDVRTIADQVRQAAEASAPDRTLGRQCNTTRTFTNDSAQRLAEVTGVSLEEVYAHAAFYQQAGEKLAPIASTLWKEEDIQAKISGLLKMADLGFFSEEETTEINQIAEDMKAGSGLRAARGDAPKIANRPPRISLRKGHEPTDGSKWEEISNLSGNTANSASNIAARLGNLYSVEDKTGDTYKYFLEVSNDACRNGAVRTVGEGDALVTLRPENNDDEQTPWIVPTGGPSPEA